jgi:hypothetical protein
MSIAEKLTTIAENEQKVYNAGYEKGKVEGGDTEAAYNQGRTDEKNEFWNNYQKYYNEGYCKYRFAGKGWNIKTFYPRYDIKPTTAANMFQEFGNTDEPFSLVERLQECGVSLDFSNTTSILQTFYSSPFTDIPHINAIKCSAFQNVFQGSPNIKTISLALKEDGSQTWSSAFNSCSAIENLTITSGTIGQNGFNVKWATKLSKASLLSILNACKKDVIGKGISITLPSKCIDGATDTETLMSESGDIDLYGAKMSALSYGYSFAFA